jgi:LacI family transcriptional regulator
MLPPERTLMKRYGVTRTTISRALAKLTDEGLLTCRPREGYTVAPVVRNGRPVKGHAIGLVLYGIPEFGHGPFASAVEQMVADAGHALMVGASGNDTRRENETLRRLAAAGMEALIITPACRPVRQLDGRAVGRPDGSKELAQWINEERPLVLQGHPGRWALREALVRRCDRVDADNADGVRQLLELLAGLGHRTAGFICQEPFAGSERYAAFCSMAAAHGLATRPAWQVENAGQTIEGARGALAQLTASGARPTAILCSHDDTALAMLAALREQGLDCPREVSLTGFENRSRNRAVELASLTTVDVNSEEQARETMRLLTKQFSGKRGAPEHVRVPGRLIDRGSVGPANAGPAPQGRGRKPNQTAQLARA